MVNMPMITFGMKMEDYDQKNLYVIDDVLALYFSTETGNLYGMETRKGYKGLLMEKIGTHTDETDLLTLDPTLVYDEFEEFYDSKVNGYQIETNIPEQKAERISIFQKKEK